MSYRVTVVIACDHEDPPGQPCDRFTIRTRVNEGGLSKTWAGYLARELDGWYTGGTPGGPSDPKRAYCPAHRAAHGHPA